MKLKEAQLLGILAFIAICIIILCMWGGGRKQQLVTQRREGQPDGAIGQSRNTESEVDALLKRLREEQDRRARLAERTQGVIGHLDVGDDTTGPPTTQQEHEIRQEIETKDPRDIPFGPDREVDVPAVSEAPTVAPRVHVVQKGDTLSEISGTYYGTCRKWEVILQANRDLIGAPEDLRPDMKLVIPALKEPEPASQPMVTEATRSGGPVRLSAETPVAGKKYYDVKPGDTLWTIAEEAYGSGIEWKRILKANSAVLGEPEDLRANMRLVLP